jgi:PAS domain-containing protein
MILSGIRSLWDIHGLEQLRKVCSTHGVHFTAFGGFLRHLMLKLIETSQTGDSWDLFDLVPFASDIDLIHTGSAEQTDLLLRSIVYEVPWGECFRWQLRSVHDNGIYWESMKVNNVIPASLMTLSTNSTDGIYDRWDGYRDYASRTFRYIRNGFYSESPLYRAGRDLELFSALLYYRVLFEAGVRPDGFESQPGLTEAISVVGAAANSDDVRVRLEQSAYLRARLRYLCAGLTASARPADLHAAQETLALDELSESLSGVIFDLPRILFPDAVLAVTAHLGGDTFRIPFRSPAWDEEAEAPARFEQALDDLPRRFVEQGDGTVDLTAGQRATLGPGQQILFASPSIDIFLGISESSHAGQGWLHEFVHFALPLSIERDAAIKPYFPDALAVLAVFRARIDTQDEVEDSEAGDAETINGDSSKREDDNAVQDSDGEEAVASEEANANADNESRNAIVVPIPSVFSRTGPESPSVAGWLFVRINCGGLLETVPDLERRLGGYIDVEFYVVGWKGGI